MSAWEELLCMFATYSVAGLCYWLLVILGWLFFKIDFSFKDPRISHLSCGPIVWMFYGFTEGMMRADQTDEKLPPAEKTKNTP